MAGSGDEWPPPSNRDWLDCDPAFAEEADAAIAALKEWDTGGDGLATQLVNRYHASPLAHTILAEWYSSVCADPQNATAHLGIAALLAPRCPHIAFALALVLMKMGSYDEAAVVCGRSLLVPDPTDPARHYTFQKENVDAIVSSKGPEHRIALKREGIRFLRFKAEQGKGTAIPPEPMWPPEIVDVGRARCRWNSMSDEERQAFLTVSFEDMRSYCRSGGLPAECVHRIMRVLKGAEELVKGCDSFSYCLCTLCSTTICADAVEFMSHIDISHTEGKHKNLWSSIPERISDSEMELLKSWIWEPKPIDGDDLAERTRILSDVKEIVFQLIDMKAISLCLLFIIHKFIMSRVRPVTPLVVSMCACCGIGQLSSAHLKELYEFLKNLVPTHTDYVHQKAQNGEQESQQNLLTWSKETETLYFDCGKIASRKTDGSSQADGLFDSLFCKPLLGLGDPFELWVGVNKNIREELGKLKLRCSSCEEKRIQGGVYFLPKAIFESDIDIEPYFNDGIGSAQVELLLIDAELDYQKKRLLEACKVDYLAAIVPIAKACLRAKLNNYPPEKILPLRPPNGLKLQAPLNMILRSLWHIRRFHDTLQKIPSECTDVKDGNSLIGKTLCEIFDSWDNDKEYKPCDPRGSMRFADFTNSLVYKKDGKRRTATEIVELIFGRLHSSQTPLHFEFKGETLEQQTPIEASLLGCICLVHDLFGLHIYENKFNCVNEVDTKHMHTTFLHCIDWGSVGKTKVESFSELLKAQMSRIESCGHMVYQYSLIYPPRLFMTVFERKDDKVGHINMHEVLMSLAVELDISHFYGGLHSGSKYILVSAVCCNDQGQYFCFARDNNRWLIYDNNRRPMYAESWEASIQQYSQANLCPEILFFEHVMDRELDTHHDQNAP
uniref:DUF629 domain-containing protein n=1 Tax=Oryza punctata TaxID=4537 RepID=A0A0E0MG93_ORYPU